MPVRLVRAAAALGFAAMLAGCVVAPPPPGPAPAPAPAPAPFPRLNAAEQQIRSAIAELQAAPNIYGGHKAAALRLLYQAMRQIEAAKAFRR